MDPTTPVDHNTTHRPDPRPRRSSLPVSAISLVLARPLAFSLHLADIAGLARTCRALKDASERALVRSVSVVPRERAGAGTEETEEVEGVRLCSASAVDSFARFTERWGVGGEGRGSDEENLRRNGRADFEDATEKARAGGSQDTAVRLPASTTLKPADAVPPLRPRQLTLHMHQLSSPTSLLKILRFCASTLTHLRITYAEHLLAHDKRIYDALASLSHLASLVIHSTGPRGCAFLRALKAPLEHVEVEFDDDWVLSVISASLEKPTGPNTLIPALYNADPAGLPTPTPTPAASPAAASALALALPDPITLLANSMGTLRRLRASNAIIVTVADKLRYPRVKTLALRLAGVPTVTPLVHAFPALAELYVYTPFDGCGVRPPFVPPHPDSESDPDPDPDLVPDPKTNRNRADHGKQQQHAVGRMRPAMPSIHATRAANRTSQLYSSFPPLARVRGFVPGLYALGLTCAVRHVEIGRLAPPSEGTDEARAVRRVLADAKPTSVTVGLGRGWWADAEGWMTVVGREGKECGKGKGRRKGAKKEDGACGMSRKRAERETARDALTSIFGGCMADDEVWAGVTDLVLRVEEPGNWKNVTRDILTMLLPLTSTLTTFVLYWDRTSVPFDRIPHDDGFDDGPDSDGPLSVSTPMSASSESPSHNHPRSGPLSAFARSRTEAFVRCAGEQNPALRYALVQILHDDPARPLPTSWSSPPATPMPVCEPAAPLCESRFFRIERSQGWLCLDALPAGVAEKVMAAEGLSFVDRVRYY